MPLLSGKPQALIIGFEEAYPLFALSTPDVGGLGWDVLQVGTVRLTCEGFGVWQTRLVL